MSRPVSPVDGNGGAGGRGTAALTGAGAGGIVAMLALALALRAPIVSVPPVVTEMGEQLGVTASAMALLTSIPVLCFGLVTPVSSSLLRVLGLRASGVLCLVGVVAGSLLRSGGSFAVAIAGTFLVGAAISIGNLVVPVLIGRFYPLRADVLMGSYTSTMNVGATAATAGSAALAAQLGWPVATASWGVLLGGVGLVLWLLLAPRAGAGAAPTPEVRESAVSSSSSSPASAPAAPTRRPSALRNPTAWLLGLAFASQAMAWYAVTAWLPAALHDVAGLSTQAAGVGAAGFQVAGILGPMLVPVFLAVVRLPTRQREVALVVVFVALWAALPAGMLLAPQGWIVWVLVTGVAQGGFFTVIFLLVVRRTRGSDENRRVAALVQTVGYLAAATAPVAVGFVHERVPGWDVLFVLVGVLVVGMMVSGVLAALRRGPADVESDVEDEGAR